MLDSPAQPLELFVGVVRQNSDDTLRRPPHAGEASFPVVLRQSDLGSLPGQCHTLAAPLRRKPNVRQIRPLPVPSQPFQTSFSRRVPAAPEAPRPFFGSCTLPPAIAQTCETVAPLSSPFTCHS